MEKFVYLFIKNMLEAAKVGYKHYEWFNNQPTDLTVTVPYPAIYLEIMPLEWGNLLNQVQQAEATFRLHVVNDIYTSFDADDKMVNNSLAHLDFLRDIYQALDMRSSDADQIPQLTEDQAFYNINTLNRVRVTHTPSLKSRFITMVDYRAAIQDYSHWRYQTYINFNITSLSGDTMGNTGATYEIGGHF